MAPEDIPVEEVGNLIDELDQQREQELRRMHKSPVIQAFVPINMASSSLLNSPVTPKSLDITPKKAGTTASDGNEEPSSAVSKTAKTPNSSAKKRAASKDDVPSSPKAKKARAPKKPKEPKEPKKPKDSTGNDSTTPATPAPKKVMNKVTTPKTLAEAPEADRLMFKMKAEGASAEELIAMIKEKTGTVLTKKGMESRYYRLKNHFACLAEGDEVKLLKAHEEYVAESKRREVEKIGKLQARLVELGCEKYTPDLIRRELKRVLEMEKKGELKVPDENEDADGHGMGNDFAHGKRQHPDDSINDASSEDNADS